MENKTGMTGRPLILAPAGNKASFLAAISAGADAVYCGLKHFSARMEAKNFTVPELIPLARLARKKGTKVYVALNAMMKTGDLGNIGGTLKQLGRTVKPDAIIIQDLSFIQLAKQTGFKGEIHLSTLANASFPGALKLIRKTIGVHSVVVPRELDIDEIKTMASACPPGLSLEVFVHGALCYGVSGRCYWSSYLGGKSGLRGRCVQPCRRLYGQQNQKKRFFSCQDLSLDVLAKVLLTIPQVKAWKIEGRKKGPHYVYHTVKAYQLLRDESTDPGAKKEALELLTLALGRPGTHYRFLPQRMQNPVNTETQTGSGLLIARVKGTKRRPYILPRKALMPGDVLRQGYVDEPWHQIHMVKKYVPKKGRLDLRVPSSGPPVQGTPVFLVDRMGKELERLLSALAQELDQVSESTMKPSAFRVTFPKRSRIKKKPIDLHVYRKKDALRSGEKSSGFWLSPEALGAARKGSGENTWWWLPPVVWPKDEENLQTLVGGALKTGGRHFVLNAPWQRTLFGNKKGVKLWAGPFCNLANELAISTVASFGCVGAIVSPELSGTELLALPKQSPLPLGIVISGNWPLSIGRTVSPELQRHSSFSSPKGEEAWVTEHGADFWIYPNWVLDIESRQDDLRKAGYCLFVHLFEPRPKTIKMKKRPGLWNWKLNIT
jgi:putative protease